MDTATRVQNLDEAAFHIAFIGKVWIPSILAPAMGK